MKHFTENSLLNELSNSFTEYMFKTAVESLNKDNETD